MKDFLDVELSRDSSVMSGSIYQAVIEKERKGHYLGKTIQVIPHITNEVRERLYRMAQKSRADIMITEIGGTVGDLEGGHFIEAARQVAWEKGAENVAFVHVGYLPYLESSQEIKTKPIQNSLQDLRARGIQPTVLFCRSDQAVKREHLRKIALFGGIEEAAVVALETIDTVYAIPGMMVKQKIDRFILKKLELKVRPRKNRDWDLLVKRIRRQRPKELRIAMVGKYMSMTDTYFSVVESLKSAAWQTPFGLKLELIDSEIIEKEGVSILEGMDGICLPGGFGKRGVEDIIKSIQFARENDVPMLGLCLGMQLTTIEYARHVLGLPKANSTEFDEKTIDPVITTMTDQVRKLALGQYGGTMRLGNFPCRIVKNTLAHKLYRKDNILERHRHRYEFNNDYRSVFEQSQEFVFSGINPDLNLVELVELKKHPFFIACQFHPEFKSRPLKPHPLFAGFIQAAITSQKLQEPLLKLPFGRRAKLKSAKS